MKKAYIIRLTIVGIIGILSLLGLIGLMYPVKIMNIQFVALLTKLFFDFSVSALFLFLFLIAFF